MGAWGYGLLQSDAELDVVDEIEDEVAKLAKTKRFRLLHPKDPARVKAKLDSGVFHRAFLYFHEKKWNHGVSTTFFHPSCLNITFQRIHEIWLTRRV